MPMESNQKQQLLSSLKDIDGIDNISWLPLAAGWWIVLGIITATLIAILLYRFYRAKKKASQRAQIKLLFKNLDNIADAKIKEKASALSEILKLLAIHKYGRKSCAGLEGANWLNWLTRHDPDNFDWEHNGKILIKAPYMPPNTAQDKDKFDFAPLIKAAKKWGR